ncbi:peptidoglycan DD-metalloendopeptidase family protein [Nocardia brasiliensis]|uniref:Peptidoglycan DD-metalloendopeptidase family protein n=1 Tax=Nocardia brasiliensis TaxID=37326 RepID=A0A6G9XUC0_NOCBR|nr:peptidoglycan DD-metalloendopeptidase family protein [Nocardia brasiliensis]
MSAVVSASLGVLAAADPTGAAGQLTAGARAAADTEVATQAAFTAFTPREAQMPQTVPESVVWEQHRMAVEAARPKTVRPIAGILTSTFGVRWGALHAGLDLADAIGTPIAAVTDGVVIEAGPASGFGMWVRVRQDDGTIGIYGHVNEILATVGQQVRAGDIIATVGNRGFSTGPHLHYEIHTASGEPIDPLPWLAGRGIDVLHNTP